LINFVENHIIMSTLDAILKEMTEVPVNRCLHAGSFIYDKYLPTIGILRPWPKALGETRKIGGV